MKHYRETLLALDKIKNERQMEEEIAAARLERPDRKIIKKYAVKSLNEALDKIMRKKKCSKSS